MLQKFQGQFPRVDASCFIAQTASVIGRVKIGAGSSVWYGTVIRADINEIIIGAHSNIQDNSVLHVNHESHGGKPLRIGDFVTIGHSAILHGCEIGDGALIGMGACVLDGAVIGEGAIIGAKALITEGKVIPPHTLAMGIPAKVVRELSGDESASLKEHALSYEEEAKKYLQEK
ncbi:MAG: gamma carbonic anhydrase family protein [Candidatus Wallbacteria bacterium]|nr:gamma carbonic anhydrase family protein [Candidatus Wallbacteria bacterium]